MRKSRNSGKSSKVTQTKPVRAGGAKKNPAKGYIRELVTIEELFQSGETKEPSLRALRSRGSTEEKILVWVEFRNGSHYYDKQLSVIRANAARAVKGPGIRWKDASRGINGNEVCSPEAIKHRLQGGESELTVTGSLTAHLQELLSQ